MATARRRATGSARQRAAKTAGWMSTPGCSLSGRSAGILYPLAGRRRICRSGRHDGDGATKSYGVSKATSRDNRRLDSTPWLLSLRPLGRHSLSVGGPPKNLPVGAPRWRRRDEKLRGQQGNEPLTTAGWIVHPWLLSLRPLGRHSLSVGGPPKNLPVGAPRWRRRDEELRGQQGNEPLKTAGWIVPPLAALSPAARPAFFIRWRAAEESAGRGATMATARRRATGSARQRAAKTAGWIVPPLAALSPAARPAFFIRWRAAEESAGRGATMATARRSKRSNKRKTRRLPTNRPGSSLPTKSPISKERLRVSNWIVQGLYNYAVKKTVELRLLTVFQHVVDPTRVRTVADKNSAVTPLDLRPTLADQVFQGNTVEM